MIVTSVADLASALARQLQSTQLQSDRTVVAIAGAPGSGKTTVSSQLHAELRNRYLISTQIVPMDGFHFDNAILQQRNLLLRKGSPTTFDVHGLESVLIRLTSMPSSDVAVPVFDRENDLSRASARAVLADTRVVLVEGNYLLLKTEPWSSLKKYFDISVVIQCDEAVLRNRLMKRWLDLNHTEEQARSKVDTNDLPNAREVISNSLIADITFNNPAS